MVLDLKVLLQVLQAEVLQVELSVLSKGLEELRVKASKLDSRVLHLEH